MSDFKNPHKILKDEGHNSEDVFKQNNSVNGEKAQTSRSRDNSQIQKKKKKRKNHSQLGSDFIAPDGKWGNFKLFY